MGDFDGIVKAYPHQPQKIAHTGTVAMLPNGNNDLVCPDCGGAVKWAHPLFSLVWERHSEDTKCSICGCTNAPVLRSVKTNMDNLEANK